MSDKTAPQSRREIIVAHASDVHVDMTFNAQLFDGDSAGPLRAVLEAAQKSRADVVLLAGDTFDHHRLPDEVLVHTAATMRAFEIPIVILPGNHDPAVEEAVFHHPAFAKLDHLTILGITNPEAVHFSHLGLEVWGRAHRDYGDMDPLAQVRERSTPWQIAMAHGHYEPLPDRSTRLRPSWLIGDDELAATQSDYVALGHWNQATEVGDGAVRAHYSGSPDYAGTVNLVRLTAGGEVLVTLEPIGAPEPAGSSA